MISDDFDSCEFLEVQLYKIAHAGINRSASPENGRRGIPERPNRVDQEEHSYYRKDGKVQLRSGDYDLRRGDMESGDSQG